MLSDTEEVARLAKLSPIEYDRQREEAAKRLGVRIAILDTEVKAIRSRTESASQQGQGRELSLPEREPWPEPVDGAGLLSELVAAILRYVVMDANAADAVALWVVHSHVFDIFISTPRLGITSPEKQCGKTTLLDVLQCLVPRPLLAANVSASVVFRAIEMARPTLLIDEADTFLPENEELRGALNSGHRSNGEFIRNVKMGEDHKPRLFSTFAPVAIALIGRLPETLEDRSIPVSLRRRRPNEAVAQFRADRTGELNRLACMTARWAQDSRIKLADADPVMPEGIYNRMADNWRPLLAIVDAVGGDWPMRARNAAIALSTGGDTEQSSLRVQLLADIRDVFNKRGEDKLPSAELAKALVEIEGRAWGDWNGKDMTATALARQLQHFKIRPDDSKFDGKVLKAYRREQFEDVWSRYLPGNAPAVAAIPLPSGDYQDLRLISHPLPHDNGSGLEMQPNSRFSAAGSVLAVQSSLWEVEV